MRYKLRVGEVHYDEDHERLTFVLPNGRTVEAFAPRQHMAPTLERAQILETK